MLIKKKGLCLQLWTDFKIIPSSPEDAVQTTSEHISFICRYFLLALLFFVPFFLPVSAVASEPATVKIGVLAKRGSENVVQKWTPTAVYLSRAIPAHSFEILPLDFSQVRQAVKDRTIDFLITNSGYYVELEYEFGVSRIATMKNLFNNTPKTLFGGVIFTRPDCRDINGLGDVVGKSFVAVDQQSLGGWLMALREFRVRGIDPERDFKQLKFVGTHDAVVSAVLGGEADAGTVRTDTLEKMAEEGKITLASLKILNPQRTQDTFPYLHSTRLYPEWPFAKLKHTGEKLSEDVAIALLSMPPQSPAAQAPHIGGWTVPLDYQPVHELLQELELGPYAHHLGRIRFAELVEQHWGGLLIIFMLFAGLLFVTSYVLRLNRKLVTAQEELAEQLQTVRSTQKALQESEGNYREIFHSTNDAFFVHDLVSGAILDVNKAMCEMYGGYSRDEVLLLSVGDLSADEPPFTSKDAARLIVKTLTEGPQNFEWLAKRRNGELFWVEVTLKLASIGGQDRVLAVVHDIEDRKKAEEEVRQYSLHLEQFVEERTAELKKSESSLAEAQRIAHLGSWEWLIPENKLLWSAEAYRICGVEPGEFSLTYESFLAVVHPADRDLVHRAVVDALEKRGAYSVEHRLVRSDGTERYVQEQGEVFWDDDGKPVKMVGVVQDITERKILEQERTRLVKAVEYAAESIVITDQNGIIQYVNPAFTKVSGYSREEVVGENPRVLKSGRHDQSFYDEMWAVLAGGESWRGHFVNRKKDGTLYEEDAAISPILDGAGKIINYVAVKHDVSERVELEKQLLQAQKLESIGTLAGGIAHDFNNILTAILGYGEMVMNELPEGSTLWENQQQVLTAGKRAADLIKQILTFSRRGDQKLRPLQIQVIVKEALKLLRASIPTTIEFQQNIDGGCGAVLADPTQVHQVVMNLCTNAYHAMREKKGGVLGVAVTSVELGPETVPNKMDLRPGSYVRLEVSDTGYGITNSVLERIFEPYFTTKGQGEGTGLGLSLVHGIVTNMGGGITVHSEIGTGTTFHVYFPRIVLPAGQEVRSAEAVQGGTERLLVVDDEAAIVRMEQNILERLGYQVTTSVSSMEAWQIFKAHPDHFDLVITDMTMPQMSGMVLASNILGLRQDMPIVLCTGFSEIINEEKAKAMGIHECLMKPISKSDLAAAIRRALGK
ncbi:MAG: PAS domain S-box protein [Desulfobulbaceae bacterium]|nr:PAS domain S-box protein [Desulfobulbaceae bacterium]